MQQTILIISACALASSLAILLFIIREKKINERTTPRPATKEEIDDLINAALACDEWETEERDYQ